MKPLPRQIVIVLVALLLALNCWSVTAPLPPAGRPKEIISFQAHGTVINDLAFSPAGKLLASAGQDSHLKLWDVASGKNLADIRAHFWDRLGVPSAVSTVAFSPDGKTVASGGVTDQKVKLWDVATGKNTETFDVPFVWQLAFNPDGKSLLTGDKLWDLETKKAREVVIKVSERRRFAVVFDPKGKLHLAATRSREQTDLWFWDEEPGQKAIRGKGHRGDVARLELSRDGKRAASNSFFDHTVRLWDTTTGENITTLDKLPKWSTCGLRFSPEGKILALFCYFRGSAPCNILLLDVPSGKLLATLKGHEKSVSCMDFSPDGRLLASASSDGIIKIWSLPRRYADEKEGDKKEASK